MYLKSIEVHGFKSFANKIVFEFHKGITGIVGPNGSGKSNVSDAVRWVLGEQSAKQLRGANMQDVIFSGTENRKPLGYAYVAITLDNSDHKIAVDYEEITVARRVYRSGESEYLMNGTSCRLKDVQELFYDTGIGKEGYSLIGQGQIDKILSGKPEERRELFDEAAGIVKFKRRKKAAQKNLEEERQNLVRIQDILSELEKQVGPLQKQSEAAKVYLKKKEELKIYDVNIFLLDLEQMKVKMQEIDKKQKIVSDELKETQKSYESTKETYEKMEEAEAALEIKINDYRQHLHENSVLKQKQEGELNLLEEQIHAVKERKNGLEVRNQSVLAQLHNKAEEQNRLLDAKQLLEEQLSDINLQQSESKEVLLEIQKKMECYKNEIEQAKSNIITLLNEKSSIQSRQQRYDTMLEQIQIRKAELNQRILKLKSAEMEQTEFITGYEKELDHVRGIITHLADKKLDLQQRLKLLDEQDKKNLQRAEQVRTDYHRMQSRLDSLINITERYDGYSNAIRRIMEQKEHNTGIIGVVADIIKVEKQYEVAIETALGGSIQNIVTDNEHTAKAMIEYLKKNHYGRATFLPLTSIGGKVPYIKEDVLKEKGVLGIANHLVQTAKQYDKLTAYLLGKTIVVDTMEHAIHIARKFMYSLRIVTLDGELLNPGGSMTGGAFKNTSNLLGRRREIKELQDAVQKSREAVKKLDEEMQKNRQQSIELNMQLKEVQKQEQQEYLKQNTVTLNLKQANAKKSEVINGYGTLKNESREIEQQIQQIGYQKKQIQEEVELTRKKTEELNVFIDEVQGKLQRIQEKESKLSQEVSGKQVEYASLFQKRDNIEQNQERLAAEIQKLEQEIQVLSIQITDAGKECIQKEKENQELRQSFLESGKSSIIYEKKLQESIKEKAGLSANHKQFLRQREELMERKNELDKEYYRLSSQKEKLEEQQESSMNYMWEEYELTYSAAIPLKQEEFSNVSVMKKQIQDIRNEIRKLGDVNVNSIEEYKNVSERHVFLKTQRDDLLEAEQTLMNIIEELDEGMRRQFTERFKLIQSEFDKAFKELFGGGKGTLELDEEGDLLEAGVRIISQPPGKKLGNMMQLSGGEKALTAIALLFAIQNLKPSPFCLLDEIEAALDDSNVSRYARYLHKLTKNTQFIIITHRRGTMAAADRLYGITMQEKGVSTLVSVDLIEEELDK